MSKTPAQRARKHGPNAATAAGGPSSTGAAGRSGSQGQQPEGNPNLIVIAGIGASVFLLGYSFLLALPGFQDLAGGLAMPDTLVGGYSTEYVQQVRTAFGADGAGQYNFWHKTADTIFPLLFALSWMLLIGTQVRRGLLRWFYWAPVLLYVIADLGENLAIDAALATDPVGSAALASFLTVAKSVLFVLSLAAGALAVFRKRRATPRQTTGAGRG
ncbi:hypothetical protein LVY72_03750 [Arthrobacter sp. I2-34]|uniref:DUF2569 domain-containing protein n=1 Tax=Arthrobacter hankyongi TaxID=2904801 RepID=A0ABS9L2Z9_9MICC|nr:hypothetical protein [Arthrobacter hankyongi]MCG2621026.1 hypothetical protein [Arthrobacter hankyongi]